MNFSDLRSQLPGKPVEGQALEQRDCRFKQSWLEGSPAKTLRATWLSADSLQVMIDPLGREIAPDEQADCVRNKSLEPLAARWGIPLLDLSCPLQLEPLRIPKPWGQEVWYSGIEARGVCTVETETVSCPLPWVHAVVPAQTSGWYSEQPILLKILAPHPEQELGDLYFELHERKQEVYVISAIDESAWPSGEGAIRIGFDQAERSRHASDAEFRDSFIAAVGDYERVRRRIDEWLDAQHPLADITDRQACLARLSSVPEEWRVEEQRLRERVDRFTSLYPLQVGDVVQVPVRLPHSLQHGVRAVEFQTPVYERKILSFGQKVLTQDHWDTEVGVHKASLDAFEAPVLGLDSWGGGVKAERVVDFDDFEVHRLTLDQGACWELVPDGRYRIIMLLAGQLHGDAAKGLGVERATLLLNSAVNGVLRNEDSTSAVLLVAAPK